ncbi:hypothetical protein SprV_0802532000 [Sparganum proliferum]
MNDIALQETALQIDYRVGDTTSFYRFLFRPPVIEVINSSSAIRRDNCKPGVFCFQTFNANRGAILYGQISEAVSAVTFYVRNSRNPQALVIIAKDLPKQAPTLPSGTVVMNTVEVKRGYWFSYLIIFNNDVQKIEVSGGAKLAEANYQPPSLGVYSPLYMEAPRPTHTMFITGYIEKTKMSFAVKYVDNTSEVFNFYPKYEDGAFYHGYYISGLNNAGYIKPPCGDRHATTEEHHRLTSVFTYIHGVRTVYSNIRRVYRSTSRAYASGKQILPETVHDEVPCAYYVLSGCLA